ncbi:hypothetical protein OEJ37_09710 [Burkholderia sp. BKH01]|uniref:hypothetical protein n=1 Tax=Burkholderia sp. BKH01 TaxID=2769262 RepID=UPI0021E03444|nr:hypothetical protein [Burkholderia sp. BKH01]MCU9953633.1 hypothetical protein [Burkholderia sp. BKH01]
MTDSMRHAARRLAPGPRGAQAHAEQARFLIKLTNSKSEKCLGLILARSNLSCHRPISPESARRVDGDHIVVANQLAAASNETTLLERHAASTSETWPPFVCWTSIANLKPLAVRIHKRSVTNKLHFHANGGNNKGKYLIK